MTIFHLTYFIEQGKYTAMKQYEFITNSIKENVRLFQLNTEELRIEWKEIGVVSKFVSNKEYSWNKDALKEVFYDHGILVHACSICNEKLSDNQVTILMSNNAIKEEKFVRFSPNNKLKQKLDANMWWGDKNIQEQLLIWLDYHRKLEILAMEWHRIRKLARSSKVLQKEKKVVFDYGTISLLDANPTILVEHFLNFFSIDELFDVVVIDCSKVEELAARGFICMSDIRKYRDIKDVKLKFFLMENSKEQAMYEFNDRKRKLLSHLSMIRTNKVNLSELISEDIFK